MIKKGLYFLVLLSLGGAAFWFSFTMALHAGRGSVPSVVGLSLDEAEKTLKEQGFGFLLDTALSRPSNRIARGTVVVQEPRGGRAANRGSQIHVGISLGSPRIAVPDLTGMNVQDARFLLMKQHLKVATVARMSWDAEPGSVIAQYPRNGTLLPKDGEVHILLSERRSDPTWGMPSFLGRPHREVSRIL